jgi:hypothetical protein
MRAPLILRFQIDQVNHQKVTRCSFCLGCNPIRTQEVQRHNWLEYQTLQIASIFRVTIWSIQWMGHLAEQPRQSIQNRC